jgi:ATP-dependent DNA ligase
VEAARRIRIKHFVLDGEAVLLGVDGISDFDGLYSGQHRDPALCFRHPCPGWRRPSEASLHFRKTNLARLLTRRADGIHLAPFEQGEIGPDLFKAACNMMLEGLVSKRRDSRYRSGPSRDC